MHTCHGIQAFTYWNKLPFKNDIYIYIYIQVEFHLIQNLNPIGIKISNQFVCCYLINPIKSGIKKRSYEQKEKRKLFFFFLWRLFFYNPKKNVFFFLEEQMFIIYRYFFFFLGEEREGVYFKLKYLLHYLQFFLTLSKNTFGKSV